MMPRAYRDFNTVAVPNLANVLTVENDPVEAKRICTGVVTGDPKPGRWHSALPSSIVGAL